MSLPINQIICGDCLEVMKGFPSESIDCVVTDPPYGIGFMGKEWDKALPPKEAFIEMFRVLKPGALAFVMSSPRQDVLWRMLQMLEECGFQLRQSFMSWIYKTGFPKAYDVSKGIDKKLGENRKVIGRDSRPMYDSVYAKWDKPYEKRSKRFAQGIWDITTPKTDLAKKWNGWKSITGLKPALECILMVNKPLSEKTIVDNVLRHGTGAINVDACRIPFQDEKVGGGRKMSSSGKTIGQFNHYEKDGFVETQKGRFPANLLVSDEALSCFKYFDLDKWTEHHGFLDVPKASKNEREKGLSDVRGSAKYSDFGLKARMENGQITNPRTNVQAEKARNFHPTVKPIKLMAYLIELGCSKDGVVLDPFVGSGTTCIAAQKLGRKWIGIELNPDYVEIANKRLSQIPEKLASFFTVT